MRLVSPFSIVPNPKFESILLFLLPVILLTSKEPDR